MPALNVPAAPVRTSTLMSLRPSNSSTAAAMPRATSPLTAFRASGRLIVMTATPSVTAVRIASDMPAPPDQGRLLGLGSPSILQSGLPMLGAHASGPSSSRADRSLAPIPSPSTAIIFVLTALVSQHIVLVREMESRQAAIGANGKVTSELYQLRVRPPCVVTSDSTQPFTPRCYACRLPSRLLICLG